MTVSAINQLPDEKTLFTIHQADRKLLFLTEFRYRVKSNVNRQFYRKRKDNNKDGKRKSL